MRYSLFTANKNQHLLEILLEVEVNGREEITLQLPAWRPGRYELGNFAKNIQKIEITNELGDTLPFSKLTKDSWKVTTNFAKKVKVYYSYYAVDFNAGSTFIGEGVLYVNPVNCFIYDTEAIDVPCEVCLPMENEDLYAGGLPMENNTLYANSFDALADSPFILSKDLQVKTYTIAETVFYIWFYGECKPNWEQLLIDFKKFTLFQISKFGDFPVKEYHFLNIIHTHSAYHGVEHQNSTVITLGPTYDVFEGLYTELLGISSHELYHTWNIKTIRPLEMFPYDFTKENYSRLGYVAEGVTTYMGDLALYESGVFDKSQFAKEFTQYLSRHYSNDGRLYLSVADSSFDTWLDGYEMGIPDRKSSIYTEGALLAFIVDMHIRKVTNHSKSLHHVMQEMYDKYGKQAIGYTEQNYIDTIESITKDGFMTPFYATYIAIPNDLTKLLEASLAFYGFKMESMESKAYTNKIGLKGAYEKDGSYKIVHAKQQSLAHDNRLTRGDLILAINKHVLQSDLDKWLAYYATEEITLLVRRENALREVCFINTPNKQQFLDYLVTPM